MILLVTRLIQIRCFTNLPFAGETGVERPYSLIRDLAGRFDRSVEAVGQNDRPRPGLAYRSRS